MAEEVTTTGDSRKRRAAEDDDSSADSPRQTKALEDACRKRRAVEPVRALDPSSALSAHLRRLDPHHRAMFDVVRRSEFRLG